MFHLKVTIEKQTVRALIKADSLEQALSILAACIGPFVV